jgi:ribosome-associated heat shock protein Hsp15
MTRGEARREGGPAAASGDSPGGPSGGGRVRLDRWLWAARFFKTRALAKTAIDAGHVLLLPGREPVAADAELHGTRPKPGKEIGVGDLLLIRRGTTAQTVRVLAVDERRGSASTASRLYEESPESVEARETERARRQLERAGLRVPAERPDKRDRRERMKLKQSGVDGSPPADVATPQESRP